MTDKIRLVCRGAYRVGELCSGGR